MKGSILIPLFLFTLFGRSQAILREEVRLLDTYGFHGPDPTPLVVDHPKIFPYFKYLGYAHQSEKKPWKVVTLENDYIQVYILPQIGGKVWGAVEKSTGNEFLYRNEVVKFRNIAMRGPWTSGGIEFNFGVIGHHPGTATPVDYLTRTNPDGSVSCVVGNLDLPSRTYWQVEIRLEKDKAYFQTFASWYNGTPLPQSYYNWMTAAAPASGDLEFFIPGNGYLEHDGTWKTWPLDDHGRNLALYRANDFGPSKSYHIVGDYQNYFGGYYHDRKVGFGHMAPYGEMPGQKLWLWALSRSGGIWEDLLTDTDGQYIEFQAGRLFNQFAPGPENPLAQVAFEPHLMDSWQETWFPVKDIGGLEAVSRLGVMNVERQGDSIYLGINALQAFREPLQLYINGQLMWEEMLSMAPMDVFEKTFPYGDTDPLEVRLGHDKLVYSTERGTLLKRNFKRSPNTSRSEMERLRHQAHEAIKAREYALAETKTDALLSLDPAHVQGLLLKTELEYRKARYARALDFANKALEMDIYDARANYWAGLSHWAMGHTVDALEALGWAARSLAYRSASHTHMAEIHLSLDQWESARTHALMALDYNRYNIHARHLLLVVHREQQDVDAFGQGLRELAKISPIDHFAAFEEILFRGGDPGELLQGIQNEFPDETLLELALSYKKLGRPENSLSLLSLATDTKTQLHRAFMLRDSQPGTSAGILERMAERSPEFVFPYRRETLEVLEWAVAQNPHWKFNYFLAQNYLAVGLEQEGKKALQACGGSPDQDTFYRFRAKLSTDAPYPVRLEDLQRALDLGRENWKNWEELLLFQLQHQKHREAAELGNRALERFPGNYSIGLGQAKALLAVGQYARAIALLDTLVILPFEHASESKRIYTQAHIYLARELMAKGRYGRAIPLLEASKAWPENLGVGAPYDPDDRLADYLLALCHIGNRDPQRADAHIAAVADHPLGGHEIGTNALFSALALKRLGREEPLKALLDQIRAKAATSPEAALVWNLYHGKRDRAKEIMAQLGTDPRCRELLTAL